MHGNVQLRHDFYMSTYPAPGHTMSPDPSIASYLSSNDPPPEKLRPALDDCISQLQSRISSLEEQQDTIDQHISERKAQLLVIQREILGLSSDRARLETEKVHAQEEKIQYEATLSPLRRIPAEVIATILGFALQTTDGLLCVSERRQFKHYRDVSRLWRLTAFSSPNYIPTVVKG
jgi:hypothetical protein